MVMSRSSLLWKYLAFSTRTHSLSPSVASRQTSLRKRTSFWLFISLMPRLPLPLLWHIVSHFTNEIFLWPAYEPHIKFQTIWSTWFVIPMGRWIVCIVYEGIVVRIGRARMARPARDRCGICQPANRSWTLSTISLYICLVVLSCMIGTLKYFSRLVVEGIVHKLQTSSASGLLTLGEKKIRDLVRLIFYPELVQKLSKHSLITRICCLDASANKIK